MTWPKVTDIKNSKYTNCRHLCPYCAMRVSKSSDHWCAFGKMSNFEKRSLRSGHLMRPGHVTFGVIGSSFFGNVSNCGWIAMANLAALRAAVFSVSAKNRTGGGGLKSPPPAGARVNSNGTKTISTGDLILVSQASSQFKLQTSELSKNRYGNRYSYDLPSE